MFNDQSSWLLFCYIINRNADLLVDLQPLLLDQQLVDLQPLLLDQQLGDLQPLLLDQQLGDLQPLLLDQQLKMEMRQIRSASKQSGQSWPSSCFISWEALLSAAQSHVRRVLPDGGTWQYHRTSHDEYGYSTNFITYVHFYSWWVKYI